jgi:hypothetical protein
MGNSKEHVSQALKSESGRTTHSTMQGKSFMRHSRSSGNMASFSTCFRRKWSFDDKWRKQQSWGVEVLYRLREEGENVGLPMDEPKIIVEDWDLDNDDDGDESQRETFIVLRYSWGKKTILSEDFASIPRGTTPQQQHIVLLVLWFFEDAVLCTDKEESRPALVDGFI